MMPNPPEFTQRDLEQASQTQLRADNARKRKREARQEVASRRKAARKALRAKLNPRPDMSSIRKAATKIKRNWRGVE